MIVYWLLLIASLSVGVPLCRLKYGRGIYCVLMWGALFITAAIRAHVGYDYNLYGGWFVDLISQSVEDVMYLKNEKGFMIPLKLISDVNTDYQVMFVAIALVLTTGIMLYIYIYSEKPYLSVFFFLSFGLFFNSMNFMRQMIAAVIIMFALQYIKKNQFMRFLALVLFAAAFHISALMMIPFYFVLRIKMNLLTLSIYSAITVFVFIFSWQIIDFVTDYVYSDYDPSGNIEIINGTKPEYAIFFTVFFILAFLLRNELMKVDPFNNVLLNCMFFTVFFEIIGVRHAVISRFSVLFFIPAFVILIPRAVSLLIKKCGKAFNGKRKRCSILKSVAVILVFGSSAFMYGYMIQNNYNGVMPYRTIYSEGVQR